VWQNASRAGDVVPMGRSLRKSQSGQCDKSRLCFPGLAIGQVILKEQISMRKYVMSALVLLVGASQVPCWAQDATKPAVAKPAEKPADAKPADPKGDKTTGATKADDKKVEEKKSSNRLPANYGKLGLSDVQKAKIYGVHDKHEAEIESLNEKLKAVKAKRESEIEGVLTPEQKKSLKDLMAAKDAKDDAKENGVKEKK
jgi:hypothetical protein